MCFVCTLDELTCNGSIYRYGYLRYEDGKRIVEGSDSTLVIVIILCLLVMLFLLINVMRLCASAFSYNNYHTH